MPMNYGCGAYGGSPSYPNLDGPGDREDYASSPSPEERKRDEVRSLLRDKKTKGLSDGEIAEMATGCDKKVVASVRREMQVERRLSVAALCFWLLVIGIVVALIVLL